ncbi:hypothetical protein AB6A40_011186 [Gnathostoma spinigerum]|uniref:Uncharacterized protein n=1 Tax=Gnathostoma spinigerum TaxID=75299 RepID=A0ABD6EZC3_9BILA
MALEGEEEQEIHSTRARGPSNDSGTQNSNEASNAPSLEGSNNRAQNDASLSSQSSSHGGGRERCTIRHGTSDQYILILDKLSKQQTAIQLQLRRYHNLLTCRRQFQADEYARRILTVYQEHLRRVIHRLSHMFHLVSDLSIGFLDTIGPHGRRVHPLTAQQHQHTATEVALSLVFVPETGRSRSSASTTRGAAQNTQMNLNEQSDRNAPENPSTHISSVRRRPTRRSLSASGRTESASGTHVPPSSSIIDSGSGISAIIARGFKIFALDLNDIAISES